MSKYHSKNKKKYLKKNVLGKTKLVLGVKLWVMHILVSFKDRRMFSHIN